MLLSYMFFNLIFNIIETLASSIKQSTQQRGQRRREKGPKSKPKTQKPNWVTKGGKGTNYVPKNIIVTSQTCKNSWGTKIVYIRNLQINHII